MPSVLFSLLFLGSFVPGIVGIEAPLYLQRIANETKDYAGIFLVPVTVGNPRTSFNLSVSLSNFDSTLIGAGSTKARCVEPTHNGFDMSRSTTFHAASTKPYTMSLDADMIGKQCVAAPVAKVTVGKDDFSGLKQVPFGVISHFRGGWNSGWPSDGILGLNGPDSGSTEQPETVKTLAKGVDATTVAIYLSST
ncbi:hypothetical protein AAVH_39866 [Aphelenchoides avenae]|nr:hypothetical protein AAVH_39866 [Aphelenchus avenae]